MTDRAQFEAMLEALINEDQETAKEIFHNIVVGKSREIYEELLSEDFDLAEKADEEDEMDEGYYKDPDGDDESAEDREDKKDNEKRRREEAMEEEGANPFASDSDEEGDEEGNEEPEDHEDSEGDIEDRVVDLEDALDELKAEFEQLMAGEEGEEHMGGDDMGMDAMHGGQDDLEMDEDDMMPVMEYVNKVSTPKGGDNGANTRSIVAGKNNMGGTSANILNGGEAKGEGTKGGLLAPSAKEENFGNMNKPGATAGKSAFKKREPGHGAEKKGEGPSGKTVGAGTGNVSHDGEKNTQSILRPVKK